RVRYTPVSSHPGLGWSGLDLFAGGASTITIQNSTIVHNSGTVGNGALYLRSYYTMLDNSTVAYNSSPTGVSAVAVLPGNAGSTFDMHSTLIASNSAGSGRNDLFVNAGSPFTGTSSNNFVRDPGSGVPAGTIVGQCPRLHQVYSDGFGWAFFMQRPSSKSPAIDAGSNPNGHTYDQSHARPRVSGPAADIGAYEVDQTDIVFNNDFEGCP
ncbi:MAG: hypothetical protein JSS28_09995, partial [Proteobacteria bacterium]|nr:hypothetical protein [Pseudomonadota bacterium]